MNLFVTKTGFSPETANKRIKFMFPGQILPCMRSLVELKLHRGLWIILDFTP